MRGNTPLSDLTFNIDGLDKVIKALKKKPPLIKVGILGDKNQRTDSKLTNAQVGATHEFGTHRLPQRSFLRMPLGEHLMPALENSGAFDQGVLDDVVKSGSMEAWSKNVAAVAEGVVLDAFDSGGFGAWIPSDMRFKNNHQTLVETQQLRNSITSEVEGG